MLPRLAVFASMALAAIGCGASSRATPAGPADTAIPTIAAARLGAACVPLDVEIALGACRVPAIADPASPAAVEAFRIADELWEAQDYDACATAFDRVLESQPSLELAAEAAYGALLCANYALRHGPAAPVASRRAQHGRGRRGRTTAFALEPSPLTAAEAAFDERLARFVCLAPTSPERETVVYRRARLYYEHSRMAEAATLFARVATHDPRELAGYAANLWLDALHVRSMQTGVDREACTADLHAAADWLSRRLCTGPMRDESVCEVVARIRAATPGHGADLAL